MKKQKIKDFIAIIICIEQLKVENKNLREENTDLKKENTELKENLKLLRDFEKARLEVAKKNFSGIVV